MLPTFRDPLDPTHLHEALAGDHPWAAEWALGHLAARQDLETPWDLVLPWLEQDEQDAWPASHVLLRGGPAEAARLVERWDHLCPEVRPDILRFFRRVPAPGVVELARDLLEREDGEVALESVAILARHGGPEDVERLLDMARSGALPAEQVGDGFAGGQPPLVRYLAGELLNAADAHAWLAERLFAVFDDEHLGVRARLLWGFPEYGPTALEGRAEEAAGEALAAWDAGPSACATWWRGGGGAISEEVAAHALPEVRREAEALLEAVLDEAVGRGAWPDDVELVAVCFGEAHRERERLASITHTVARLRAEGAPAVAAVVAEGLERGEAEGEKEGTGFFEDADSVSALWEALQVLAASDPEALRPHAADVARAYADGFLMDEPLEILRSLGEHAVAAVVAEPGLGPAERWRVLGRLGTPAALDGVLPQPGEHLEERDIRAMFLACRPDRVEALAAWQAAQDDPFAAIALLEVHDASGRVDLRAEAWLARAHAWMAAPRPPALAAPASSKRKQPGKAERKKRKQHRRASQQRKKKKKKR